MVDIESFRRNLVYVIIFTNQKKETTGSYRKIIALKMKTNIKLSTTFFAEINHKNYSQMEKLHASKHV